MKKIILVLLLVLPFTAWADQITKMAVVDYNRILSLYYKDSRAVQEYKEYEESINQEAAEIAQEIQDLKSDLLDARQDGDERKVLNLEKEIEEKTNFLVEYVTVKKAQLAQMRDRMESELTVVDEIIDALQYIAESNGYSIVMRKDDESLLWYSYDVDITDKVITYLMRDR